MREIDLFSWRSFHTRQRLPDTRAGLTPSLFSSILFSLPLSLAIASFTASAFIREMCLDKQGDKSEWRVSGEGCEWREGRHQKRMVQSRTVVRGTLVACLRQGSEECEGGSAREAVATREEGGREASPVADRIDPSLSALLLTLLLSFCMRRPSRAQERRQCDGHPLSLHSLIPSSFFVYSRKLSEASAAPLFNRERREQRRMYVVSFSLRTSLKRQFF